MKTELKTLLQDSASGFECAIDVQDLRFHCMIPSGLFLPAPPISLNPHNHPYFELHVIQSGSLTLLGDQSACLLEKNDLALIPPKLYHAAYQIEDDVHDLSFFFRCEQIKNLKTEEPFFQTFSEKMAEISAPLVFRQAFGVSHAMLALIEEMGQSHPCKSTRLKWKIAEILLQLIDLCFPDTRGVFSESYSQPTREKMMIDAFFANNVQSESSLTELSESIFLSERQTNRVLQSLYSLPYKQKLIETRVFYAKFLLATTTLSVDEISIIPGEVQKGLFRIGNLKNA